ncbi:MAG: cation:proton antiporter [Betaproteobacteria bacterium]
MEFTGWMIAIGVLLIVVHASGPIVADLPLSPAILYFLCGVGLGPWGLDWLRIDPAVRAHFIERLCELALLVSLFATGSSLGSTLRSQHWTTPIRLATVAMVITIGGVAALAFFALDMPLGGAIVLAAALAPTDPVLASDVQVADANDRDRLRFGLTGEAGLNDGAAFPFMLLGLGLLSLHELGNNAWRWWVIDLGWGLLSGIAIGATLGLAAGRLVLHRLRNGGQEDAADLFLGLGLVAVAYGIALSVGALGFLAVFAAAVALQWTVTGSAGRKQSPSERRKAPTASVRSVAIAPLQRFNSDLESLFEFGVVIVIGVLCTVVHIPWEALLVAAALFLVIRPVAVFAVMQGTSLRRDQRALAAWFGIRGVGSLYYATYALNHGWSGFDAERMLGIVLGVVAASILVHGISVTPAMSVYQRHQRRPGRQRRGKKTTTGADDV